MQITLGQACEELAQAGHAYGGDDMKKLINRAIQALSKMSGWECLRKVLRFSSVGPEFVLPQGCAGLVRACVNGRPVTMRGQDFRFLRSGLNDTRRPPSGFTIVPQGNIIDLGFKPVMKEPLAPFRVFAFADGIPVKDKGGGYIFTDPQPRVTIRGIAPNGADTSVMVLPFRTPFYSDETGDLLAGTPLSSVTASGPVLQVVSEVTVDKAASRHFTLYAQDESSGANYPIGVYNPKVLAPMFRHYEIQGIPRTAPVELIVEARVDPLPLVDDTDVLPFDTIEPIEWMIQSFWQVRAGELSRAETLRAQAAQWLKALETTNDTIQTELVINSRYEGSPGEISDESWNV